MLRRMLAVAILGLVLFLPVVAPAPHVAVPAPGPRSLSETGQWEQPFDGQVPAVNMVLGHNGQVLYWSGVDDHDGPAVPFFLDDPHAAQARILDLSGPAPVLLTPPHADGGDGDMFCSDQTVLPDGQVLVVGGTKWVNLTGGTGWHVYGLDAARTFDFATGDFTTQQAMVNWRWYPTSMTLADGDVLVSSGIADLPYPQTHVVQLEKYDTATKTWSTLPSSADNLLPLYPRLVQVPSGPLKGQIYYNPVGCLWCPFGENPGEVAWNRAQALNLDTNTWTDQGASLLGVRQHGTSTMLTLQPPEYKPVLLTAGGTLNRAIVATNTAELTDLSVAPPAHQLAAPMNENRWFLQTMVLPTGEVLTTGGGKIDSVMAYGYDNEGTSATGMAVLPAEIFDPSAKDPTTGLQGHWTEVASMQVPRMYHSTALLLPDGRVLVGGHVPLPFVQTAVSGQINERRLEIYDPPYLFRGPRPTINAQAAPTEIKYGGKFDIPSPQAADVTRAVLIRPGSVTHSLDIDQRAIQLELRGATGNSLHTVAPPDADVAPPGWYMLFIQTGSGDSAVPSVAQFVHLS